MYTHLDPPPPHPILPNTTINRIPQPPPTVYCAHSTAQELAGKLGVRGLPMIIFYKKGKRVDHFTTANINTIEEAIRDNT